MGGCFYFFLLFFLLRCLLAFSAEASSSSASGWRFAVRFSRLDIHGGISVAFGVCTHSASFLLFSVDLRNARLYPRFAFCATSNQVSEWKSLEFVSFAYWCFDGKVYKSLS